MPQLTPEFVGQFVERLTDAQSALCGCIHAMMAGDADVADVLQETNRVLWKKAGEYDAARPFLPWALTIARFEVLAHRKRQSRDRLVFDDALVVEIAEEFQRQAGSSGALGSLEQCLQKLPAAQRALVESRYMEGVSVNDLAARQGRAANAVSAQLYRVRRLLADCIDQVRTAEGVR
jgi:RNA polymerase sigma-70 factor (ECF subfamily)